MFYFLIIVIRGLLLKIFIRILTCKFGQSKKTYFIGTAVYQNLCCKFILLKSDGLKCKLHICRLFNWLKVKFNIFYENKKTIIVVINI